MSTSPVPHSYPLANQLHHVVNAEPVVAHNRNSFVSKICNILTKIFPITKIAIQYAYETINTYVITSTSVGEVSAIVAVALALYNYQLCRNREASNPIIVVYTSIAALIASVIVVSFSVYCYKERRDLEISPILIVVGASTVIGAMAAVVAYVTLTSYNYKLC